MRRGAWTWLLLTLAAGACDLIEPPPAPRCAAVEGEATPTAEQVCARLSAMDCHLPDCAQAYASYATRVSPGEFNRLTSCYLHATSCAAVGECELACGADGGMVTVNPPTDASLDAGTDTGADAGVDVPAADAPAADAPAADAPTVDVPTVDAPTVDVPATDVPATDVPAADVPTVDVPAADVPTVDVPAADIPAADASVSDDVAADAPVSDDAPIAAD